MSEMNLPSHVQSTEDREPWMRDDGLGLDPDYVADIWEDLEEPSFAKVAQVMADRGIMSPSTGRPYTRQNLHLTMHKTDRGSELVAAKTGG